MKKKLFAVITSSAVILSAALALLIYNGIILLNNPSEKEFPVRGIDVSEYQGKIDWNILSHQNIDFAFIKATEGSGYADICFEYNFSEIQKTDLDFGAYHFFSYDSSGKTQADNFINAVGDYCGTLPPVADVEFYGEYNKTPPDKDFVTTQLNDFLDNLESFYGVKPVIYTTEESYKLYIDGEYDDYPIWIRNIITSPNLSNGRSWTFWQYSNRTVLSGYKGEERFIDMNVFNGTTEEFLDFLQ